MGNNDDEYDISSTIAVNTYYTLRIEVDSTGDGYFYVDGNLKYAENEVVATTARLIPYIMGNEDVDDGTGAGTMIIDYLEFVYSRPSS